MFTGYAQFNGTEITNYDRTYAYLAGNPTLGIAGLKTAQMSITNCGCPNALALYCDPGAGPDGEYTTVAEDEAPWYDSTIPASTEFLGLLPVDMTGWDAPLSRSVRNGAVIGGSLGPLRAGVRLIPFDGWLIATTCAGAEYGLRWLTEALMGSDCVDCGLGELYVLASCPTVPVDDGSGSGSGDEFANSFVRYTYRTGLVDGPKVIERQGQCCSGQCACQGTMIHVQFTLGSESPYIFGEVDWTLAGETFDLEVTYDFDFEVWCSSCVDSVGTQTVNQERPRQTRGVILRADGSWCRDGWAGECPPSDSILAVTGTTESAGSSTTDQFVSGGDPREITLGFFRSWTPVGWLPSEEFPPGAGLVTNYPCPAPEPVVDVQPADAGGEKLVHLNFFNTWYADGWLPSEAFPPPGGFVTNLACPDPLAGTIVRRISITWNEITNQFTWAPMDGWVGNLADPGYCYIIGESIHITNPVVETTTPVRRISVTYDECTNTMSWAPLDGWSGTLLDPGYCYEVGETIFIEQPAPPEECHDPEVCHVNIDCDGTWYPLDCVHDECAPFPVPNRTYVVGTVNGSDQDTSNIVVPITVPGNLFIPDCGPPPLIPPPSNFATADCYCIPWTSVRMCTTLVNEAQWNDGSLFMVINTGSSELRNMRIAAYQNIWADQGVECPCDPADPFWLCKQPCAEVQIPQLPASTRLIIDSRLRTSSVRFLNGIEENGLRYIQGPGGAPFDWFDVGPCSTYCVVIETDYRVAPDANVSVGFAPRYLASGY